MCFLGGGGGGGDPGAAAREAEAARQGRISSGTQRINETFGQFDDSFFGGVRQDALDFFNPQLNDQFEKARKRLILSLARGGNLNAGTGANQLADLTRQFNQEQARVGDLAQQAETGARTDVERNRSDILSQLIASANPASAGASAISRAQLLSQPQTFSPLGELFANVAAQSANQIAASRDRRQASLIFPISSGGSSRVVN